MLLIHQTGSVKIGEVVRYTVTYTPSADRILPSPQFLYLRIKNTCAIALRAAFVHGPYTLSVAAYPSNFNPNEKFENPRRYGVPEFEPMLKAGAAWNCHLIVPDNIRQSAGEGSSKHGQFGNGPAHEGESVSWIIEIASQVVFSTSAAVHYEVLLARDEKSLNLGSVVPVIGGQSQAPQPGRVSDFQQSAGAIKDHPAQQKGVFSRAIHLKVEDTAGLWNRPKLPGWDDVGWLRARSEGGADAPVEPVKDSGKPDEDKLSSRRTSKPKKVHLVILTHGLHANLGADMLFLKESIDAGVRQAKIDAKARKAKERAARKSQASSQQAPADSNADQGSGSGHQSEQSGNTTSDDTQEVEAEEDEDDEEVVVRGFPGNATKTERGIKYLGKRLARFILAMTYPDQPCLPTAKAASEAIVHTLKATAQKKPSEKSSEETHKHSSIRHAPSPAGDRLYKFTKISFIGHSLGGLVQTYAIAYIQKHSPQFFDLIEPINFIAMASPLLGLNHENPLYVKFALDFGLVGRTGQDLGLTWRAPTIARNGWGALVGNLGEQAHKRVYGESQPESKPLLRILPTGPAHKALKKFRNRTVYSNVVNDGIVPLRTSCLLFLDWQGLGRVEKARREAGLMETVVAYGWAELTGANVTTPRLTPWSPVESKENEEDTDTGKSTPTRADDLHEVPQPPTNAMLEDDQHSLRSVAGPFQEQPASADLQNLSNSTTSTSNPLSGLFNFFRSEAPKTPPPQSPKINKIYQRSQTLKLDSPALSDSTTSSGTRVTAGIELMDDAEGVTAPPRTSIFESAGDLLNPKLPTVEYLIDPSKRPRAIFHDRIYHPSDIPPPPPKERSGSPLTLRRRSRSRTASSSTQMTDQSDGLTPLPSPGIGHKDSSLSQQSQQSTASEPRDYASTNHTNTGSDKDSGEVIDSSQMRVEEKIARAYHRGLSWRKVLVKLEPDAHNNIMVRRMFANAFGWPVIHHLVQAHFSDEAMARARDENEPNAERAKSLRARPDETGRETRQKVSGEDSRGRGVTAREEEGDDATSTTTNSEDAERYDVVPELAPSPRSPSCLSRQASANALGVFAVSPPGTPAAARPPLDRYDSMTWSDKDFADSADESEDEGRNGPSRLPARLAGALTLTGDKDKDKGKAPAISLTAALDPGAQKVDPARTASPLSWNWTEKIVGKGALSSGASLGSNRAVSTGSTVTTGRSATPSPSPSTAAEGPTPSAAK
ncbi:putative serine esterase-domain-containing protein [Podospora australis]|uniref:Serine esterase-domain-containing protein n=1 Tax=Podospora australis TaxID=1536484 RepID=A0AAN6X4M6_9PEZI|nr:putative serine esterase-domain-containing protein [Podospora australis]